MFTGAWVSDGIEDWTVSFVCEGEIGRWLISIVSVVIIEEEEPGIICLLISFDEGAIAV